MSEMLFLLFSYWAFSSFYMYNLLTADTDFNKEYAVAVYSEMKAKGIENPEKTYHYSCVFVSIVMGWFLFPRNLFARVKNFLTVGKK